MCHIGDIQKIKAHQVQILERLIFIYVFAFDMLYKMRVKWKTRGVIVQKEFSHSITLLSR